MKRTKRLSFKALAVCVTLSMLFGMFAGLTMMTANAEPVITETGAWVDDLVGTRDYQRGNYSLITEENVWYLWDVGKNYDITPPTAPTGGPAEANLVFCATDWNMLAMKFTGTQFTAYSTINNTVAFGVQRNCGMDYRVWAVTDTGMQEIVYENHVFNIEGGEEKPLMYSSNSGVNWVNGTSWISQPWQKCFGANSDKQPFEIKNLDYGTYIIEVLVSDNAWFVGGIVTSEDSDRMADLQDLVNNTVKADKAGELTAGVTEYSYFKYEGLFDAAMAAANQVIVAGNARNADVDRFNQAMAAAEKWLAKEKAHWKKAWKTRYGQLWVRR